jgi:phosphoribosylaminoimidazole-succinocarboxamide synthase
MKGGMAMTTMYPVLLRSDIPGLPLENRGKVRDLWGVDNFRLLFIATDRVSAFDVVMDEAIPYKGVVLTQLTLFWLRMLEDVCPNHTQGLSDNSMPQLALADTSQIAGRSMLVRRVKIVPVESIVRGYLEGSGWKDYNENGHVVCGLKLPDGMRRCDKLPETIWTPSTKADQGLHDENIDASNALQVIEAFLRRERIDLDATYLCDQMRQKSIELYKKAAEYALTRGIIIADTKFEFGLDDDGDLVLADEVLTPDSSRFWSYDDYRPGRSQDSFDKQPLRNWLQALCDEGKWDKTPPPPTLSEEIIAQTSEKYRLVYTMLTGKNLI